MTDETKKWLHGFLPLLVRMCEHNPRAGTISHYTPRFGPQTVECRIQFDPADPTPDLTAFQKLCIAGLLGDEAVLPQAVADYLIDQGHEYALAVAEKARLEERERIKSLVIGMADSAESGDFSVGLMYSLYDQL